MEPSQGATLNTPKTLGRLAAALEPMQGLYSDLESVERRMRTALDVLLGVEDEPALDKVPVSPPDPDSLESHIKSMVHNYFTALDRLQTQVNRLEKV